MSGIVRLIVSNPPKTSLRLSQFSDWHQSADYSALLNADRTAFAWEWLRRSPAYRRAWFLANDPLYTPQSNPRLYGLEKFEDPIRSAPAARPIWSAEIDPLVIRASVVDPLAPVKDRVDLRLLAHFVSLAIDENHVEHLLLSDGLRSIRIDVLEGTLIGCPSSLQYSLQGIAQLRGPIVALKRMAQLVERGRFWESSQPIARKYDRWILELRVSDALASGATYQEIARTLFEGMIPDVRWRADAPSYRQRVQRLAKNAYYNLRCPLQAKWFTVSSGRNTHAETS